MAAQPILDRRSLGLKFLLVCVLAVLMSIPAFGVFGLISERTGRANSVVAEIGARLGGEQTLIGPILVAPYRQVVSVRDDQNRVTQQINEGWYAVFAQTGAAAATLDTDVRARGTLFKVRTYAADVAFNAAFDLSREPSAAPEGATVDWSRAALVIGVSDTRGVVEAANIQLEGGAALPIEPGSAYAGIFPNLFGGSGEPMRWLAVDAASFARPGATFSLSTRLRVTGVESFSLTAFARTTDLRMQGDWEDVGYFGDFAAESLEAETPDPDYALKGTPPVAQPEGFAARWSIPFVRRNLADAGPTQNLDLSRQVVTTRFVDTTNPYQAVTRSLKYALLFIGVVFLAYFLFEATSDTRVHPAQYVLVGLAQIIFYLLLLAIAERIGFNWAFLVAAVATVGLIGWYAGAVFKSRTRQYAAIAAFSLLYALIYVLMSLEDFALLVGAVAAFVAIAAVMWFTRNLDWYGLGLTEKRTPPPAP